MGAAEPPRRGVQQVTLLDGAVVSLRRLENSDIDAVVALHRQLSEREQYFRFFMIHPPHMAEFAKKVVRSTPDNVAVGAFEGDDLIGVANYVRAGEPTEAEVAVAVAHQDHLRGVATALLRHLGKAARGKGIRYFVADILAENSLMLQVLRDAGWLCTHRYDGSVLHVRIDLSTMHD